MRFGLIGLGAAGQLRRAALARAPDCVLTAVFYVDRARTEDISPNVVIFPSAEALLKSDSCEAIIVSTPPNSHEHLAVAALENGKHVLVEKPMAHSVEACGRMLESSRRADRVLAVGFNHRYFAAVKVVRDAISSGMIGKLSYIRAYAGHTGLSEFSAPWMYARDVVGGGTLMDNGIHVLDLVCHLMGGVDYIRGTTSSRIWHLDVEDNAFGCVVRLLDTNYLSFRGERLQMRLSYTGGWANLAAVPQDRPVVPTFSDMLGALRLQMWQHRVYGASGHEVPSPECVEMLLQTLSAVA